MDTVNTLGKNLAKVSQNKSLLLLIGAIFVSILIGYLVSKQFRSNLALKNFRLFPQNTIRHGTDYCLDYFQNRGLADFHIFSSSLSGSIGFTKYDYLSNQFLEEIVRSGARYVEFTIMASDESTQAKPVISIKSKDSQSKQSINVLPCKETFESLSKIVFSRLHIVNYTDPFFIYLDIQTNKREVQDKLRKILATTFSKYLLPENLRFEKANLGVVPVCELMKKVVFFCNETNKESTLKQVISSTVQGNFLKRIPYSSLLLPSRHGNTEVPDFFIESQSISFHEGIGNPYIMVHDNVNFIERGLTKEMKINITGSDIMQNNTLNNDREPFNLTIKQITPQKIIFEEHRLWKPKGTREGDSITLRGFLINKTREGLVDYNRTALTIVVPDENIFANNYNPKNAWYLGCHFVALYFQTTDENWKKSKYFFRKRAIRLKQNTLLRSLKGSAGEKVENEKGVPLALFKEPKADPQFSIDYSLYKKVLGREITVEPLLNNQLTKKNEKEVRLIRDGTSTKLGLYTPTNSVFYIQPAEGYNNTGFVTILSDNKFLSFNPQNRELEWIENKCGDNVLAKSNFMKKTNFIVERETIPNSESYQIAYIEQLKANGDEPARKRPLYLTYSQKFAPSKMIYTRKTNKYEEITRLSLEDGRKITIWRPIPSDGFIPLGDVITLDVNGESTMPTEEATLVNGAITTPMDYELVWDNKETQLANPNSKPVSFWKPIPPTNLPIGAFHSFGLITTPNYVKPDTNTSSICCVLSRFTRESDFGSGSTRGRYQEIKNNPRNTASGKIRNIAFWRPVTQGYNYFVISYITEDIENTGVTNPEPPREIDFPLRVIRSNTDSILLDKITLSEEGNQYQNHFKIKMKAKGGYVPIDQNVYDTIANLPTTNQKFKTKLYVNYQSGEKRCLSLPDGYWNQSIEETKEFGNTKQKVIDDTKEFYDILPKGECSAGSNGTFDFLTEEEICSQLGGEITNYRYSTDRLQQCSLELCRKETERLINRYSVVKKGECPNNSKKGEINIPMNENECKSLGGIVTERDSEFLCNFDICNENPSNEMILSRDKNSQNAPIKRYFKGQNSIGNPIKMEPCQTDNVLSTNYKYSADDNQIKSLANPRYCVTADKKEGKDEYNLFLNKCSTENPLQRFTYNNEKQIISNTIQTNEGVPYCINANFDDTTSMKPCENPIPTRQRWELDTHSRNYCIRKGSTVLVFQLEKREPKMNGVDTPLNPPIDNLLSEVYDDKSFHYWIEGRVVDIKDGQFHIKLVSKNNIMRVPVTSTYVVPDMDLVYQLNETPKKGDVMLVKDGGLEINGVYYNEDKIYWKAAILGKVPKSNNLYKVALTINSIEPNANNQSKRRPPQTSVKNVSIDKMRFYRRANVCNTSINL